MDKEQAMAAAHQAVNNEVKKILSKQGVTPRKVAKRLREALDATEVVTKFDGGPLGSGSFVYSKKLVSHTIRLQAVKIAAQLLEMEPAQKVEFPDESGKPQNIGAAFGETERSARLLFLLETAEKRAREAECK